MNKNKKSLAGTSESIQTSPKLYPKPKRLSNDQEAALKVVILVVLAIILTAEFLFILQMIYKHGLRQ